MLTIRVSTVSISSTSIDASCGPVMKFMHIKWWMKYSFSRFRIFQAFPLHCNIFLLSTIQSLGKKWMILIVNWVLKIVWIFWPSIPDNHIFIYRLSLSSISFLRLRYLSSKIKFSWQNRLLTVFLFFKTSLWILLIIIVAIIMKVIIWIIQDLRLFF